MKRRPSPSRKGHPNGKSLRRAILVAVVAAILIPTTIVMYLNAGSRMPAPPAFEPPPERDWAMEQIGIPTYEPTEEEVAAQMRYHKRYLDSNAMPGAEEHSRQHCALQHFKAAYRHKKESPSEVDVEYIRIPPMAGNRTGVMLFFHGCGHSARDFCLPTPQCPSCLGLVEEMRYVHAGLSTGLEVIAVSSPNKGSKCWANSRVVRPDPQLMWNNRDVYAVLQVLKREEVLGTSIPLIAMGASSGGSVLSVLPAVLGRQLFGVIAQISAPSFPLGLRPPAVVYDVMAKDHPLLDRAVNEQMAISGVRGARSGIRVFNTPTVDADSFSQRIPGFPATVSREIVQALYDDPNLMNPATHMLRVNPRTARKHWVPLVRAILQKYLPLATTDDEKRLLSDTLAADASIISEQLNVLYGMHEFFAEHAYGTLRFIIKYS